MLWIVLALSALTGCTGQPDHAAIEREVLEVMKAGEAGWNAGDIPAYMDTYWKDDDLRFASGANVTRGWQPTLDRYLKGYPDRATMGKLEFSELEVTVISPDAALVFGRWALERADDNPNGLFTLLLRKFPGGWRIVADHTSSAD